MLLCRRIQCEEFPTSRGRRDVRWDQTKSPLPCKATRRNKVVVGLPVTLLAWLLRQACSDISINVWCDRLAGQVRLPRHPVGGTATHAYHQPGLRFSAPV